MKTLTVTDDAYQVLQAHAHPHEPLSHVIARLAARPMSLDEYFLCVEDSAEQAGEAHR